MITFVFVPLILLFLKRLIFPKKCKALTNKHVIISGGSSGIGKSAAIIAARKGANVTILARNLNKLEEARKEILKNCKNNQVVRAASVDVSDKGEVERYLEKVEKEVGPVFMLLNCAGIAICGEVENLSDEDITTMIKTNYLGTLYPIQVLVPKMKKRNEGIIVVTASQVALMGMYGYSVYSSCKFALRGLAESIAMELNSYNVSVTLSLPPDTDTPGYQNENKTKPEETKLISQSAGLVQPEVVAQKLIDDALNEKFFSYVGFESKILTTLCVGMSPFASFFDVLYEACVLGPLRLIGAFYIRQFQGIIAECHKKKVKIE